MVLTLNICSTNIIFSLAQSVKNYRVCEFFSEVSSIITSHENEKI